MRWHRTHRRDFPWRRTRDPYRILVSEVMLQQTRAEQVVPLYRTFVRRFPSATTLAAASPAQVLKAWHGLGYNRRAVHLHRAAKALAARPFPHAARTLEQLPGLGRYSAGAVAVFAFGAPEPLVETNVRRVLHRVFVGPDIPRPRRTAPEMYKLADALLDRKDPTAWNEALFDLGATVCRKRAPQCGECPLQPFCRATPRILVLAKQPLPRRIEPMFRGIPRRLWRGQVLGLLHRGPKTLQQLLRRLGLGTRDGPWLLAVLVQLIREGLAARQSGRFSLPRAKAGVVESGQWTTNDRLKKAWRRGRGT
jgi:A/G-specific adenine glycosylase